MLTPDALINLSHNNAIVLHPALPHMVLETSRLNQDQSAYVSDLWQVTMEGSKHQLTHGEFSDTSPAFSADGTLYFLSNRPTGQDDDHKTRRQVFAFPPRGGDPRPITNEPLGVSAFKVAGENLILVAPRLLNVPRDKMRSQFDDAKKNGPSARLYTRMPVRHWDHWIPQAAPHLILHTPAGVHDLTPLADREFREAEIDVTPDGRWLIACKNKQDADRLDSHELVLFDLISKAERSVFWEPRVALWGPTISPDGAFAICQRNLRHDTKHGGNTLVRIALDTGEMRRLDADDDIWLTPRQICDGVVICEANYRGNACLFGVDSDTGAVTELTRSKSVSAHHTRGGTTVALASSILHPPEPHHVVDGGLVPICATSGFTPNADIVVESIEVASTDGRSIQGFIVKPRDAHDAPCLLTIHGGPISAWNDVWHWRWNARTLAAQGYVVALPNPRGSTGFGQDFVEGIWGNKWGGQCYADLMCFADALEARPDVDARRIVAMGGSFGGYMTNWIGCSTNRFAGLINHAGLTNLSAFHGVTDHPAWWIHMFGESPYKADHRFDQYSPHLNLSNWVTPVLIIHGQNDYRVPIGEALRLFDELQARSVDSEFLVFPDENHWILKPRNVIAWYEAVLDFVNRRCEGRVST